MRPVAVAALLLLLPSGVRAFERSSATSSGPPFLFWRDRTVPFVLNSAGSRDAGAGASLQASRESFAVWAAPACTDLRFSDGGLTDRTDVGFDQSGADNFNLVIWRERNCVDGEPANEGNCWDEAYSAETIAVTTTTFSSRSGELFDADVEFNGAGFIFTTLSSGPPCARDVSRPPPGDCIATDVKNTLVHELGHYIGLDHVDDPEATMYRSAVLGETRKRTLAQDDVDGVCTVYPAGVPTPGTNGTPSTPSEDEDADEGNGCGCASGGPEAVGAGLLPALWWASRRRRPGASPRAGSRVGRRR